MEDLVSKYKDNPPAAVKTAVEPAQKKPAEASRAAESEPSRPAKKTKKKKSRHTDEFSQATAQIPERAPAAVSPAPAVASDTAAPVAVAAAGTDFADRLSGGWGGARHWLQERGWQFEAVYKGDFASDFKGGSERKAGYLGNLDLKVNLDAEKQFGVPGLKASLYGLGNHGFKISEKTGDSQGVDNIEAPTTFKLYEAYLEKVWADGKFSVLAGLHDLNAEFFVTDSSANFLQSAFGVGTTLAQSGANGPSIFPTAGLALRFKAAPAPDFYLMSAVFEGTPGDPAQPYGTRVGLHRTEGLLAISEAGYAPAGSGDAGAAKYGFGVWAYTAPVDRLDGAGANGNYGAYALADHPLGEGWSVFARPGWANPDVNEFEFSLSAGLAAKGVLFDRADDVWGVGLASAWRGGPFKQAQAGQSLATPAAEHALELFYRFEWGMGLALTPDFQYVIAPGPDASVANAWVGILRAQISL